MKSCSLKKIENNRIEKNVTRPKARFLALYVAIIVIVIALISKYKYQLMLVQGDSMLPTYHNLQLDILQKDFDEATIQQGDVIAFQCDGLDDVLVKRVVGLPGQAVCINNGTLYVDGEVSEYYDEGAFDEAGLLADEICLKQGEFIVIGDNIRESKDSRYKEVGVVRIEDIKGVVL